MNTEETSLPAGTRIRVGRPADQPQEAIDALIALFSTKETVVSAALGLLEAISPDGKSDFTYTIGIEYSSDEAGTIRQAFEVLQSVPTGRWPISVVPASSQFFPKNVPVFFGKKKPFCGAKMGPQSSLVLLTITIDRQILPRKRC